MSGDNVRAVYREMSDPSGWPLYRSAAVGVYHLGHEPAGTRYRITGRGRLADLEVNDSAKVSTRPAGGATPALGAIAI